MKSKTRCILIIIAAVIVLLAAAAVIAAFGGRHTISKDCIVDGNTDPVSHDGKVYTYNHDLINILCMGVDNNRPLSEDAPLKERGKTDALYLLSINKKTKEVNVVHIPRETMVPVQLYYDEEPKGMQTLQITLQYAYGRDKEEGSLLTSKATSALLKNIPIQRYCVVNFNAIPALNDAVGGVEVTMADHVDKELQKLSPDFRPGNTVLLKGEQSFNYLRFRDISEETSSEERAQRQKVYIKAFEKAMKKAVKSDFKLPYNLYKIMQDNMSTDIGKIEILYLTTLIKDAEFADGVISLPGEMVKGERFQEYYVSDEELEKMIIDTFYCQVDESRY